MEDFKKQVAEKILEVLPEDKEKVDYAVDHLVDTLELRDMSELALVQEKDLSGTLGLFKTRRLLDVWKNKPSGTEGNGGNTNDDDTGRGRGHLETITNQNQIPNDEPLHEFRIDWEDIYKIDASVKLRLKAGKKLRSKQKREFIKRIVSQVRCKQPYAKRALFKDIVEKMKKKYPVSFHSELAKGKIGRKSLCFRMQTKFDNERRPVRRTRVEQEAPGIKPAYGCKKWRLASIPQGESAESLQKAQEQLAEYFETTRHTAWDSDYIEAMMEKTFGMQREDINKQAEQLIELAKQAQKAKRKKNQQNANRTEEEEVDDINLLTTEELRDKWPFLFVARYLVLHFNKLTAINLDTEMDKFQNESIDNIIKFMVDTSNNDNKKKAKKIKKKMERAKDWMVPHDPEIIALISLLVMRFNESIDSLWILVDSSAKEDDIPVLCKIPKTPRLIIAGESVFQPTAVYFTMDAEVLGSAETMREAIMLLFASYFVFNLEYDVNGQVTMEFFQRCVANINPPQGNKRPKKSEGGRGSSYMIHQYLTKFNRQYEDFMGDQDEDTPGEEEGDS